jgi:hypothetical protein
MFRSIFTLPASALSNYGLSSAHRQKAEANTPLGRRAAACRPRVMASRQDGIALDPATASLTSRKQYPAPAETCLPRPTAERLPKALLAQESREGPDSGALHRIRISGVDLGPKAFQHPQLRRYASCRIGRQFVDQAYGGRCVAKVWGSSSASR